MIYSSEIQRIARGEIQDKTVEKDYIQTWVLIGLVKTGLDKKLIFKGGTALRKFHYEDYRYSSDLDFTLSQENYKNTILDELEKIIPVLKELTNIQVQVTPEEKHEKTITCYIDYTGPLGGLIEKNRIKTDITVKESKSILYPVNDMKLLPVYSDQPGDITYPVYSIEEIVIEKLCSILAPARHEPRDIYDLWYILEQGTVDIDFLADGFLKKCEFKGLVPQDINNQIDEKEARYKKLWEKRLRNQLSQLPQFDNVYRALKRYVRKLNLL